MPLFYAHKGKALTEEGTSPQEQSIARGLRVDLEWVDRSLQQTQAKGGKGVIQTPDGSFGPADVSATAAPRPKNTSGAHTVPFLLPF